MTLLLRTHEIIPSNALPQCVPLWAPGLTVVDAVELLEIQTRLQVRDGVSRRSVHALSQGESPLEYAMASEQVTDRERGHVNDSDRTSVALCNFERSKRSSMKESPLKCIRLHREWLVDHNFEEGGVLEPSLTAMSDLGPTASILGVCTAWSHVGIRRVPPSILWRLEVSR